MRDREDARRDGGERYGSHRNVKNDVRLCPECKKEFTDGASLIGHLIISHAYDHEKAVKRVDRMENAGVARCPCGGIIEPAPGGEDDLFECTDCGKMYEKDDARSGRYKAINALRKNRVIDRDQRIDEGKMRYGSIRHNADSEESGPYKCLDCGTTFGVAGETWYRCEKCKSRNIEGVTRKVD